MLIAHHARHAIPVRSSSIHLQRVCLTALAVRCLVRPISQALRTFSSLTSLRENESKDRRVQPFQTIKQTLAAVEKEISQEHKPEEDRKHLTQKAQSLRFASYSRQSLNTVAVRAERKLKCSGYGWTVALPPAYTQYDKHYTSLASPFALLQPYDSPLLVILVSQSFFGEGNFECSLVDSIRQKVYGVAGAEPPEIQLLVVAVERVSIPSGAVMSQIAFSGGTEGISFFWTTQDKLVYQSPDNVSSEPAPDPDVPGSLTVRLHTSIPQETDVSREFSEFKIPLANTMFKNGRTHTMFLRRFVPGDDVLKNGMANSETFKQQQPLHMDNQDIRLDIDGVEQIPVVQSYSNIVQTPLTQWKSVAEVSGNVVKRIQGDDGPMAASIELEAELSKRTRAIQGPYEVWAEIAPNRIALGKSAFGTLRDERNLIKVVSGGGGWGDKRGLVALDPTSVPEVEPSETLDFKNLFPNSCSVGDRLRFLLVNRSHFHTSPGAWQDKVLGTLGFCIEVNGYTTFAFGTTGIPDDSSKITALPSQVLSWKPFIYGHFGAMSQRMSYKKLLISSTVKSDGQEVLQERIFGTDLAPFTLFNQTPGHRTVVSFSVDDALAENAACNGSPITFFWSKRKVLEKTSRSDSRTSETLLKSSDSAMQKLLVANLKRNMPQTQNQRDKNLSPNDTASAGGIAYRSLNIDNIKKLR